MCLQFLQLLESSSSLLAYALCTLGLANSVNSDTIGIMNRISDTHIFKHEEKFKENYIQYLYTFHLDPTVFFFIILPYIFHHSPMAYLYVFYIVDE